MNEWLFFALYKKAVLFDEHNIINGNTNQIWKL